MAPTRRRFITLRLPMSGTSPEAAEAFTVRATALGAVAAFLLRPRTLHPSLADMVMEVMEAMVLTFHLTVCVVMTFPRVLRARLEAIRDKPESSQNSAVSILSAAISQSDFAAARFSVWGKLAVCDWKNQKIGADTSRREVRIGVPGKERQRAKRCLRRICSTAHRVQNCARSGHADPRGPLTAVPKRTHQSTPDTRLPSSRATWRLPGRSPRSPCTTR